jgi:Cd2+/Zn2+-exporting ATPase
MDSDHLLPLRRRTEPEPGCASVLNEAVAAEPGIVGLGLDSEQELVAFDFNPAVLSGPQVATLAHQIAPAVRDQFTRCRLRLGRQGGRACEACALALENQLHQLPGVRRATASYRGGMLTVTYDQNLLTAQELAARVRQLGVPLAREEPHRPPPTTPAVAPPSPWQRARSWLTSDHLEAVLTVVTLIAMLVGLLAGRLGATALVGWIAYAVAYAAGSVFGLQAGLASLRRLTIDVDLLMILAAIGAAIVGAPFEGAMLLFLFSLSNVLQNYALDRTRNAIRALMQLRPAEALVRQGDQTVTLPIEEIKISDVIIVRPGERIPLDGTVVEGESGVDQSPITGESIPVIKHVGDTVLAGTINQRGALEIRVTRLAQDSTLARLIQLVEEAQSEKAPTQRFIDRAEQYYALGVILMTTLAIIIPIVLFQESFQPAFYRAMTLMVAASPCALVISTPATVLSAIGNGARRGVLFKGGVYLEQAATIKVVAFDKTGTLTIGRPRVTDIITLPHSSRLTPQTSPSPDSQNQLLALAAAAEAKSEHPLAQAILTVATERRLTIAEATSFQSTTGKGVQATVNGQELLVGSLRYLADYHPAALAEAEAAANQLQDQGKTTIAVARLEGETAVILGLIAIADTLRPDAPAVIRDLKQLGVSRVIMLTGDNQRVAQAIAAQAGVDAFYADLLPEDKMRLLRQEEQRYGPVAMVGDGVNDAPALAAATIGIAMGAAGTDVALETADVVLMADNLQNIPYAIALSRQTRRTLLQNLTFALAVILILIASVLGFSLPLPLSVIGHEGSTVLVSLNGLRLLAYHR